MKLTFKYLTEIIAENEGMKEQVNIAQIKEITRITLSELASRPIGEISGLLDRYRSTSVRKRNGRIR